MPAPKKWSTLQYVVLGAVGLVLFGIGLVIARTFDAPTSIWLLLPIVFLAVSAALYFSRHKRR